MTVAVEPARAADRLAASALVQAAGLPAGDLAPDAVLLVAREGGDGPVVGCVAVEVWGGAALVRSLAVGAAHRGRGLGARLLAAAEAHAAGVAREAWLLTETAAPFFAARGWRPAARADAPEAVRRSSQFEGLRCRSARCFRKALGPAA